MHEQQSLTPQTRANSTNRRTVSMSPPMPTDWLNQSVCMFFNDYVVHPNESIAGFGFLQGAPDMFKKETDSEVSPFQEAVWAVSLTNFAHRSTCFDYMVPQSRRRYGKALQLLSTALRDQEELKKDSTLATVLCLGIYEACRRPMDVDK